MIHQTGYLKPTKEQLDHAKKWADDSFCTVSDASFLTNFPVLDGWQRGTDTAVLLKLKNVEPHDDPWVSNGGHPKKRRAIFWLLEGGQTYSGTGIFFGCGRDTQRLRPGDFVVFNDAVKHWVMSDRKWLGASVQLRGVK